MRLLHVDDMCLTEFHQAIPPYAVLSHTWGNDEVTYDDICSGVQEAKSHEGWAKLHGACQLARKDGLDYFWIDTCCINKSNITELQETVGSMFRLYKDASRCYVYLADVSEEDPSSIERSRYFTGIWTIQELFAAKTINFYDAHWHPLGERSELSSLLAKVTGVPEEVLNRETSLLDAGGASRRCAQCGEHFDQSQKLEEHARDSRHAAYRCFFPGCDKTFVARTAYSKHNGTHSEPSNGLNCELCGRAFPIAAGPRKHERTRPGWQAGISVAPGEESLLATVSTQDYFPSITPIRPGEMCSSNEYYEYNTLFDLDIPILDADVLPTQPDSPRTQLFGPGRDQALTMSGPGLTIRPIVRHIPEQNPHTSIPRQPSSSGSSSRRMRKRLERPHQCAQCSHTFLTYKDLKRHHISMHSALNPFQCAEPSCGREFKRRDNLILHCRRLDHKPGPTRSIPSTPAPDAGESFLREDRGLRQEGIGTARATSSTSIDVEDTSLDTSLLPIHAWLQNNRDAQPYVTADNIAADASI